MKKTKICCVASAVAISTVSGPMMNVLATNITPIKEESVVKTITTDEFVQTYLSTKSIVKDKNNVDQTVYTLITTVDESNYKQVLQGNVEFLLLKEDQQKEIVDKYENKYKEDFNEQYLNFQKLTQPVTSNQKQATKQVSAYDYLVDLATKMNTDILAKITKDKETLQKDYDSDLALNSENYTVGSYTSLSTALTDTKKILDADNNTLTIQNVTDAQTALKSAKESLVDISELKQSVNDGYDFLESDKDMLEETSYTNFKKVLDDASVVLNNENATTTDVSNTLNYLNDYFDDNSHFEYKTVTLDIEPVAPVVEQQSLATTDSDQKITLPTPSTNENVTTQTQEEQTAVTQVLEPATTVQETSDTVVTQFISTYLTSTSGNVFTSANSLNASKILSGMQSWVSLSGTQKNSINSELIAKGSKKYMVLVQEAQKIQLSSKTVNTATSTNSSVYAMLSVISLGFIGFITKKLKRD